MNTARAEYRRNGEVIRTRFYPTKEEAQDALARRIGWFHHLGRVAGDGFVKGRCLNAPRNGGLVSIEFRQEGNETHPKRWLATLGNKLGRPAYVRVPARQVPGVLQTIDLPTNRR